MALPLGDLPRRVPAPGHASPPATPRAPRPHTLLTLSMAPGPCPLVTSGPGRRAAGSQPPLPRRPSRTERPQPCRPSSHAKRRPGGAARPPAAHTVSPPATGPFGQIGRGLEVGPVVARTPGPAAQTFHAEQYRGREAVLDSRLQAQD
jgi:hypothetical protein